MGIITMFGVEIHLNYVHVVKVLQREALSSMSYNLLDKIFLKKVSVICHK